VTSVVDTSVLIDYLRGHRGAATTLEEARAKGPLHASEVTRLEVLAGMRRNEEAGHGVALVEHRVARPRPANRRAGRRPRASVVAEPWWHRQRRPGCRRPGHAYGDGAAHMQRASLPHVPRPQGSVLTDPMRDNMRHALYVAPPESRVDVGNRPRPAGA